MPHHLPRAPAGRSGSVARARAAAPLLFLFLGGAAACDRDGTPDRDPASSAPAATVATGDRSPDAATPGSPPRHVLIRTPDGPTARGLDSAHLARALALADTLPRLRCLMIARHGETLTEHCRPGYDPAAPANVKSVSKSVLSALVGIAIDEGHLAGVEQRLVPLLESHLDTLADPRKRDITIGHLLSMQSGLERTSGRNYGAWVSSPDWVRDAIRRPMEADPGGRMLYSTGNYHLLSAILTDATGSSTWEYARSRLGDPLGVRVPRWPTDPQGIYFGGNDMRLSPRAMVAFGELYRNGGRSGDDQVVPEDWVRSSLEPRTRSPWSGNRYGYGWFLARAGRHPMFFAWGYGGQFIFVVPDLELTVVTTSDPAAPRGGGHLRAIHDLLDNEIVPAAEVGSGD